MLKRDFSKLTRSLNILILLMFLFPLASKGNLMSSYCTNYTNIDNVPHCESGTNPIDSNYCCSNSWSDSSSYSCREIFRVSESFRVSGPMSEIQEIIYCNGSLSDEICTRECNSNNSIIACNGNSEYCSQRLLANFTACSSIAPCNCIRQNVSFVMIFHDDMGITTSNCTEIGNFIVFRDSSEEPFSLEFEDLKVFLNSKGYIRVNNPYANIFECVVRNQHILYNFTVHPKLNYDALIPERLLITDEYMNVTCYYNNHYVSSKASLVYSFDYCPNYSIFKLGFWRFLHCNKAAFIITIVIVMVLILSSVLVIVSRKGTVKSMLLKVLSVLSTLIWLIKMLILIPFMKGDFYKLKGMKAIKSAIKSKFFNLQKKYSDFFSLDDKKESLPLDEPSGKSSIKKGRKNPTKVENETGFYRMGPGYTGIKNHIFLIALCCVVVPISAACSSSTVLTGSVTDCSTDGLIKNCKLSFESSVFIDNQYEDVCVNIKDAKGVSIMSLEFSAVVGESYTLESLYYTSDYTIKFHSNSRCNGETIFTKCVSCPDGGCHAVNEYDPYVRIKYCDSATSIAQLQSTDLVQTGFSGCVAGDSSSSCAFKDLQCNYYRYVINPVEDSIYRVSKFYSPTVSPKVNVRLRAKNVTENLAINTIGRKTYLGSDKKVSMRVLGTFQTSSSFNEELVVASKGSIAYLTSAAKANIPKFGVFGDIQANTEQYLKNKFVGWNNFAWDKTYLTVTPVSEDSGSKKKGDLILNVPSKTGFQLFSESRKMFPQIINGNRWVFEDGILKTNLTSQPVVQILLKTETPINVQYTVEDIDPDFSLISASGCLSCSKGFTIIVKGKSLKTDGVVYVTTKADIVLKTNYLDITTKEEQYTIRGSTGKHQNSFYIDFEGTEKIQSLFVSFEAKDMNYISNSTDSSQRSSDETINNEAGIFDGLPNFFSKFAEGELLPIIAIIVISIGILLTGVFIFSKFVPKIKP